MTPLLSHSQELECLANGLTTTISAIPNAYTATAYGNPSAVRFWVEGMLQGFLFLVEFFRNSGSHGISKPESSVSSASSSLPASV